MTGGYITTPKQIKTLTGAKAEALDIFFLNIQRELWYNRFSKSLLLSSLCDSFINHVPFGKSAKCSKKYPAVKGGVFFVLCDELPLPKQQLFLLCYTTL